MKTAFLLAAQYDGRAIIPLEDVRRDFFSHLTTDKFQRKLASGEIALPVIRIEASQKAAKGVHLDDLSHYLDSCMEQARSPDKSWAERVRLASSRDQNADPVLRDLVPHGRDVAKEVAGLRRLPVSGGLTGVYFLFDGDLCVYVGQSINVHSRVNEHRINRQQGKVFDSYAWIPCEPQFLIGLEAFYIRSLRPKYNKFGVVHVLNEGSQ